MSTLGESTLAAEVALLESMPHLSYIQKLALKSKKARLAARAAPAAGLSRTTRARRIDRLLQEIGQMRDAGASADEIADKFRAIAAIRDGRPPKGGAKQRKESAKETQARARDLDMRYRQRQQEQMQAAEGGEQ